MTGDGGETDPSVLNSPRQLGCSRTACSLRDDFIDHVGDDGYLVKESVKQMKLVNDRQMNEKAAVGDDGHGCEAERLSAADSLLNQSSV